MYVVMCNVIWHEIVPSIHVNYPSRHVLIVLVTATTVVSLHVINDNLHMMSACVACVIASVKI